MREGIDFLRKREGMMSLVLLAFLATLLSYPLITFLPVMARDVFHGDSNTFTLFLCLSGAGSVTGALLVAGSSANTKGQAKKSLTVMLILGAFIAAFGLSKNLPLSAALIFASGLTLMIMFALNTSLVQSNVGDAMRGRVMSVYNVAFRGGMPLGSVICGYLIKQTSVPVIMTGNGVLVVLLAIYFLLVQKKLTKL
jgi:predicted MFS family arabinose efflux permease